MRPIDADSLKAQLIYFANHMQDNGHSTYAAAIGEAISIVDRRQTLDTVLVQHEGSTSLISVKDIDEWEDRIILDEGDKSKRCKVYYADAPVVPGRWTEDGFCSECGNEASYTEWLEITYDYDWNENLIETGEVVHRDQHLTEYCPRCGARMDGEPDDDSGQ